MSVGVKPPPHRADDLLSKRLRSRGTDVTRIRRSLLRLQPCWVFAVLAAPALAQGEEPRDGGAACVMAKWMGQTMDYVLVVGEERPRTAVEAGERRLIDKGYAEFRARGSRVDVIHPQAVSALPHAFAVVIRSDWESVRGRPRRSYGCGFSSESYADALWRAIGDLQRHAWGWKPDRDGYELVEKRRY